MKQYRTLYKIDSKGKTRIWFMESEPEKGLHRTVSGIIDGKHVTTAWTQVEQKNVGKANETTLEQQVESEVESIYNDKMTSEKYVDDISKIENVFQGVMLAHDYFKHQKKVVYPCIVQPKLDGLRCYTTKDGMFSRNNKPIVSCPHIHEQLKDLFEQYPDAILDGELYNHYFHDDFNELQSMIMSTKEIDFEKTKKYVQYWVYDVIVQDNWLFRTHKVFQYIEKNIDKNKSLSLRQIPYDTIDFESELVQTYEEYIEQGYEGLMIRNYLKPYEQKRSHNLLKYKTFIDEEFEIVDILEGIGNRKGWAARVLCKTKSAIEFHAGINGNEKYCKELLQNKLTTIGKYATIKYFNLTPDGKPRFGKMKCVREDI